LMLLFETIKIAKKNLHLSSVERFEMFNQIWQHRI